MRVRGRKRAAPRVAPVLGALVLALGCSPEEGLEGGCQIVQSGTTLPTGLEESSGVAVSRDHAGVLWTHNDSGGDPEVVAVQASGQLLGRVAVRGARARDWEDIALAPCPAGTCLYVADTGDGSVERREIGIYRLPEPDPARDRAVDAEHFSARYPNGPRDAEALFVLPSGELFLVTKGREGPIEIYRYPLPLRPDETVTLELVRILSASPRPLEQQVTGASASRSGEWVAIRTYKRLQIWRADELPAEGTTPHLSVDLTPLGEVQGEAVALLDNGAVVLTSEGGFPGAVGSLTLLNCELEGG